MTAEVATKMLKNIRFVKGTEPVTVELDGLVYQAGKLSFAGSNSIAYVLKRMKRFLKEAYNYDIDAEGADDTASLDALAAAETLLTDPALLILACDTTQSLTCGDILDWPVEFINKCYKVLVELNPQYKAKVAQG